MHIKPHANKKKQQATPGLTSQPQEELTDEQLKGSWAERRKFRQAPSKFHLI